MHRYAPLLVCLLFGACGKDTSSNNATPANNSTQNASNGMTSENAEPNNIVENNSNNSNNSNNTNNTNNTTTTIGPIGPDTWTQHVIAAYCEATFDCPGSDFYLYDSLRYYLNTYGSKEACVAAAAEISALFGDADLRAAVDAGRLVFDGSAAQGCLDAYLASACDAEFDPTACDGVFVGQVADAQNCAFSDECSNPDSACQPIMGTCFGACGAARCGGVVCAANEYCDANDVCTALRQIGETCNIGECVADSSCNFVATDGAGTCVADDSVANGGYCWTVAVCVADHFCDFTDDTCKPFRLLGEACEFGDCADPLVCNVDFATNMGTCVMPASIAQGGQCVDSTVCAAGLYCDIGTDTCEPANKPLGADCTFSTECASGVCNYLLAGGTCAAPNSVPAGGPCGLDIVCMDGLSCDIFGSETCRGLGADGDACDDGSVTFVPVVCAPGLICSPSSEGTCGPPLAAGAPCEDFTQCGAPLACIGGICQGRAADGAACQSPLECESFMCDGTSLMCESLAVCMVP